VSTPAADEPVVAIGTRGSVLARIQAGMVADELLRTGHPSRIVIVETDGDRRAADTAWGEGAFVAAIEQALLDGRVDVAVHSAKDVPTDVDPRLRIGAYLERADARDALVVREDATERRLAELPHGARVGTDSPRRTAFLLARRPDLEVHPLHGNVDTRLRRLDEGETDALVLACGGLDRLGRSARIAERFDPGVIPPAPGQGAIAVQVRAADIRTNGIVASIDHPPTRLAVEAERAFLDASGGGCRSPIGAYATISNDELDLLAGAAEADGSGAVTVHGRGPLGSGLRIAGELAVTLAAVLGRRGSRVIVTRAIGGSAELISELHRLGLVGLAIPAIAVEVDPADGSLNNPLAGLEAASWIVLTSANGVRAIAAAATHGGAIPATLRWAVIGRATAGAVAALGVEPAFIPSEASAECLAAELPLAAAERVVVVRGDLAGQHLADALRRRGANVDDVIAYRTIEAPQTSVALLGDALAAGPISAIVFTSGSTVRGLAALAHAAGVDLTSIPAVCVGPRTAQAAVAVGFRVAAVAPSPDAAALAAAVGAAIGAFLEPISIAVEA
jgi:hydroxymethylbilane synthase